MSAIAQFLRDHNITVTIEDDCVVVSDNIQSWKARKLMGAMQQLVGRPVYATNRGEGYAFFLECSL